MEGIAHPAIIRHARRWRMEHTLATMQLELPIHLYTAICLYRHDANARFSEGDRQFKEDIVPHLVQAWHINAIHTLDAPPPMRGVPRARAVVDRFGLIHNAESSFASLLQLEFGGWQGPRLPDAIMHIVGGDVDVHRGFGVIISLSQQLPDGTSVVTVRVKTALDGLTRREMTVARAFASGKSYRQIAAQLGTSPATVRTQIQAIYMKIGVRTKVGLVHAVEAYLGSAPPLR
ncbi:MAG: helix-turn-helix transcriptional regulator [Vicinamibacterales bacterium]